MSANLALRHCTSVVILTLVAYWPVESTLRPYRFAAALSLSSHRTENGGEKAVRLKSNGEKWGHYMWNWSWLRSTEEVNQKNDWLESINLYVFQLCIFAVSLEFSFNKTIQNWVLYIQIMCIFVFIIWLLEFLCIKKVKKTAAHLEANQSKQTFLCTG